MSLVDEDLLEHTISGPNTASHGQMTEGENIDAATNKALQSVKYFYCEVVSLA